MAFKTKLFIRVMRVNRMLTAILLIMFEVLHHNMIGLNVYFIYMCVCVDIRATFWLDTILFKEFCFIVIY